MAQTEQQVGDEDVAVEFQRVGMAVLDRLYVMMGG